MSHNKMFQIMVCFYLIFTGASKAANFTLNDSAIMSLDWKMDTYYSPPHTSLITARRDIAGPGVEFDIYFPGNADRDSILNLVSSEYGGSGILKDINISNFDAFELQFTLLSINGSTGFDASRKLIAGSIIDIESTWGFRPEIITMAAGQQHIISTTATDASIIDIVGFTVYIPYWWWTPQTNPWSSSGSNITILVQPVETAFAIPEPATVLLFAFGVCFFNNMKIRHLNPKFVNPSLIFLRGQVIHQVWP